MLAGTSATSEFTAALGAGAETIDSCASRTKPASAAYSKVATSPSVAESPNLEAAAAAAAAVPTTETTASSGAKQLLLESPSFAGPGSRPDGAAPSSSMARSPPAAPLPEPFATAQLELPNRIGHLADYGSTTKEGGNMDDKMRQKNAAAANSSSLELPQQAPGKEEAMVGSGATAGSRRLSPEAAAAKLARAKASSSSSSSSSYREGGATAFKASAKQVQAGSANGASDAKRGAKMTHAPSSAATQAVAQQKSEAANTASASHKEVDDVDAKSAGAKEAGLLRAAAKGTPERKLTAKGASLAKKAAATVGRDGAGTREEAVADMSTEAKASPSAVTSPPPVAAAATVEAGAAVQPIIEASLANPVPPNTAAHSIDDPNCAVNESGSAAAQLASATENTAHALWLKLRKVVSQAGSEQSALAALGMRAHVDGNEKVDPFEFEALLHRLGFMAAAAGDQPPAAAAVTSGATANNGNAAGTSHTSAAENASAEASNGKNTATSALVEPSTDAAAAAVSAAVVAALLARVHKHSSRSSSRSSSGDGGADVSCCDLVRSLKDWDDASPWRNQPPPRQPPSNNHQYQQPASEPMLNQASAAAAGADDAASSLAHSPARGPVIAAAAAAVAPAATAANATGEAATSRDPSPATVAAAAATAPGTPSLKAWRAQATGRVRLSLSFLVILHFEVLSHILPFNLSSILRYSLRPFFFAVSVHISSSTFHGLFVVESALSALVLLLFSSSQVKARAAALQGALPVSPSDRAASVSAAAAGVLFKGGGVTATSNKSTAGVGASSVSMSATAASAAAAAAANLDTAAVEVESVEVSEAAAAESPAMTSAGPPPLSDDESESPASVADLPGTFSVNSTAALTVTSADAGSTALRATAPPPLLLRAPPPTPASPADDVNSDAVVTARDTLCAPVLPSSASLPFSQAAGLPLLLSPQTLFPVSRSSTPESLLGSSESGSDTNSHGVYGGGFSRWVSPSQRPSGAQAPRQAVLARAAAWSSNGSGRTTSSGRSTDAKSQAFSGGDSRASAPPPTPAEVDNEDEDETGEIPAARVLAFSPSSSATKAPRTPGAYDRALNRNECRVQKGPTSASTSLSTAEYTAARKPPHIPGLS